MTINTRFFGLYLKQTISSVKDYIQYDLIGPKPKNRQMGFLPTNIDVQWSFDPQNKSYFAEVTDHKGIYSTAESVEELVRNINIQLFEYYNIPQYFHKEMRNHFQPSKESLENMRMGKKILIKVPARRYQFAS